MARSPGRTSIFHSAGDYSLGDELDPYVTHEGFPFIGKHVETGCTLADFGCWGGRHLEGLREIAGPDGKILAIDGGWAFERLATLYAKPLVSADDSIVEVRIMGVSDLDEFDDGTIDGAICWRVLHNLTEPGELERTLRGFNRVMVRGAPLLVATRAADGELHDNDLSVPQYCRSRPIEGGPERGDLYFTEAAVRTVFSAAGFRVEGVDACEGHETVRGQRLSNRYWAARLRRR
ncbi:MAG: class I SAM-dependent methyltransferase [Myxococcales bacterium]|nr:class I SAM-dependent methyltransferase [Myxococcales bacterium]